jgi:hypothetical protein
MPPKLRAAGYSALKKGGCAEKNKNNEILVYTKNRPAAPSTFQKKKKRQEAYLEDGGGHEDSGDTVVVVGVHSARPHAPFVTVDGLPELAGALASKASVFCTW